MEKGQSLLEAHFYVMFLKAAIKLDSLHTKLTWIESFIDVVVKAKKGFVG